MILGFGRLIWVSDLGCGALDMGASRSLIDSVALSHWECRATPGKRREGEPLQKQELLAPIFIGLGD